MNASYPSLAERVVLVVGGDEIGDAVTAAFCAQRARVGFIDADADRAQAVADRVAVETGRRPVFRERDPRDAVGLRADLEALIDELGAPRALINCAGDDSRHSFEKVTPDDFDDRMAINARYQFFAAQAASGPMAAAGGGSIVNMGSNAWITGAVGQALFAAAKAAVTGITRALARDLGAHNIRVNAIAAGWALDAGASTPERMAAIRDRQCLKSHLTSHDVADLALWLAADDSRMCAGQTIVLDGGLA